MTPTPDNFNHPKLKRELQALYNAPPVPAGMDDLILAPCRRRTWPKGLIAASIAAVALIGGGALYFQQQTNSPTLIAYTRTGDIRDAFHLARALDRKQPVDASWDQNADGRIDNADVTTLAQFAVRLNREVPQ